MASIIWGIIVVLFVLWLIGVVVHLLSWGIHILLLAAIVLIVWNLVRGRRII